ncbi:MAG: hypothetical protein JGK22_20130 [Microcoleus sp. PH2017_08_TRC_O_A]|nr:hypothetical protein [Microcoleus sp. PH2017_08_TRC_O_A]
MKEEGDGDGDGDGDGSDGVPGILPPHPCPIIWSNLRLGLFKLLIELICVDRLTFSIPEGG